MDYPLISLTNMFIWIKVANLVDAQILSPCLKLPDILSSLLFQIPLIKMAQVSNLTALLEMLSELYWLVQESNPIFGPTPFVIFSIWIISPHCACVTSPYTHCSGQLPNLTLLCTFGCQVYVLPPHASHQNKLQSDTCTGIFLGYLQNEEYTLLQPEQSSSQVCTPCCFNEAMSNSNIKSPNAWLLCGDTVLPADIINTTSGLPFLDISTLPFTSLVNIDVSYNTHDTLPFGIEVSTCTCVCHAYISSFSCPPLGYTLCTAHWKFLGSYVISINDQSVFSTSDINTIHPTYNPVGTKTLPPWLWFLHLNDNQSFDNCPLPTQLQVHNLWHISALQLLTREGMTVEINQSLFNHPRNLSTDHMEFIINHLQSLIMTKEECTFSKLLSYVHCLIG